MGEGRLLEAQPKKKKKKKGWEQRGEAETVPEVSQVNVN